MPDVRMPDGTVIKNVPEGTTRAQLMARLGKQKPDTRPTSFWQGVKEGVSEPLFNMARLAETASEATGGALRNVGEAISAPIDATLGRALEAIGVKGPEKRFATVNAAQDAFNRRQAQQPVRPSGVGRFVGNVAGTLPAGILPGGPFAQGAYSSGLLTKQREPDLIAAEMATGGVLGKAGDKALRSAASLVAPKMSDALGKLVKKGVRITPGQATRQSQSLSGRLLSSFEDRATSLPGPTGQLARAERERAGKDFVYGGINDVLGEIGELLPDNPTDGHGAVKIAQRQVGKAYDGALAKMDMVPDQQFAQEFGELISNARSGGLAEPQVKQLETLVRNSFIRRVEGSGGRLSGKTLQTVMSELKEKARRYSGSSVASEQEYGDAVSGLIDIIEGAARRSSPPEMSKALDAANRAYAKLVRVEGAAKNATGGFFTPGQLETSIRQADSTVRKRGIAAGEGLMQDYAEAGRAILPSGIGESGTAPREALWQLQPWLFDLASYPAYKASTMVGPRVLARQPGANAQRAASILRRAAPSAAVVAPAATYGLLGDR